MIKIRTIEKEKNLFGKTVILRNDFNLPLKSGRIVSNYKIIRSLKTFNFLLKKKTKIISISHLGRPQGKRVDKLSLKPVAKELSRCLKRKVYFINDCLGDKVFQRVNHLKRGDILVLENLRFYPGEEKNNKIFSRQLASLGEIYVNDAFAVSHRSHASVVGITKYLPSFAGFLLKEEIDNLSKILRPKHFALAIIGGAKISTKIKVIQNLAKKFDEILLGGALANNIFFDRGYSIGRSLVEKNYSFKLNKKTWGKIVLPKDVWVLDKNSHKVKRRIEEVKEKDVILDIGPETKEIFKGEIRKARTIVWNGPLGYFENKKFAQGTKEIIDELLKNKKATVVIGGGETVAALSLFNSFKSVMPKHLFVSTGGGAMLEFLEGKILPGIKPLCL